MCACGFLCARVCCYLIMSKIQMCNLRILMSGPSCFRCWKACRTLISPVISILSKSSSIRFDCSARVVRFSQSRIHLARKLASDIYYEKSPQSLEANSPCLHSKEHSIIFHAYLLYAISNFQLCEIGQLEIRQMGD